MNKNRKLEQILIKNNVNPQEYDLTNKNIWKTPDNDILEACGWEEWIRNGETHLSIEELLTFYEQEPQYLTELLEE